MPEPDLHTRLRSAIEERLRLAEHASVYLYPSERWRFDGSSTVGPRLIVGDGPDHVWTRNCNPAVWACDDEEDGCPEEARGYSAEGRLMAANDPHFVIRACRADLARLEQHIPMQPYLDDEDPVVGCGGCSTEGGDWRYLWPCPEVRSLAEVWLEDPPDPSRS